jgi:hypothetical protein
MKTTTLLWFFYLISSIICVGFNLSLGKNPFVIKVMPQMSNKIPKTFLIFNINPVVR